MARFASKSSASARRWAARRLPPDALGELARDPDPIVRMEVAYRLAARDLLGLVEDADPRVRYVVAERIGEGGLAPFLDDPDVAVRALAGDRLAAFSIRHVGLLMGAAPLADDSFMSN